MHNRAEHERNVAEVLEAIRAAERSVEAARRLLAESQRMAQAADEMRAIAWGMGHAHPNLRK
jgi:hypothetical protein